MGLVQNLKKTLSAWGDKILVELSCHYIKHLAKQTLKRPNNSSPMGFSLNPLTREDQHTTIVTSSADTSEKTTMMETEELVLEIRQWALNTVKNYPDKSIEGMNNKSAIMAEFEEWIDPAADLEVVSLDEISEDQYDDFVDQNK